MALMQLARRSVMLLILYMPTLVAATRLEGADAYRVYVLEPTLSNHAIRPDAPLPDQCKEKDRIRMMAARGEYEPASFVIETQKLLSQVHVKATDLRNGANVIRADAVDARVVAPVFRYTSDFPTTMNWVLLHDPNLIEVRNEAQPPALQPGASEVTRTYLKTNYFTRAPVDSAILQAADVARRQQFWLTIRVPEQAKPGLYQGTVTITAKNLPARKMTLELRVPSFDLVDPQFEYSVYYPAWLEGDLPADNPQGYAALSPEQYLIELQNMNAHGCRNPVIYSQARSKPDKSLDLQPLEAVLKLREQAGMPKGRLYLNGAASVNSSAKVNPVEYKLNVTQVRNLVAHLKQRDYADVFLMGADEATGEALFAQREAWRSVREGGGKIFVAHYAGYTEGISDLLDLPVMLHPMHAILDRHSLMPAERFLSMPSSVRAGLDVRLLLHPEVQQKVRRVHQAGHRIYTYMDPTAGHVWVDHHRRMRGLGLWRAGLDGTMTWAYTHITQPRYRRAGSFQVPMGFVIRGAKAPFDTLSWEAYREGYDDARYLATLQRALAASQKAGRHAELVTQTRTWLEKVEMDIDLDEWRREMARRTELLLEK